MLQSLHDLNDYFAIRDTLTRAERAKIRNIIRESLIGEGSLIPIE